MTESNRCHDRQAEPGVRPVLNLSEALPFLAAVAPELGATMRAIPCHDPSRRTIGEILIYGSVTFKRASPDHDGVRCKTCFNALI